MVVRCMYGACMVHCMVHVWCMYGAYRTFENNFSAMYGAFMTKVIFKEEQQSILFQPIARPIGKQYE